MSQQACWKENELHRILKPDAEEIMDYVFRAVHCQTELHVADTADGPRNIVSPEDLVQRFLDPQRDYVQAVVLGDSGTGKSHLIQWLRLQIQQDDDTVLLTIPKTRTSLRGIIERLIECLPTGVERQDYEERLRQAGTQTASHEAKLQRFLSVLAWVIEHGGLANEPKENDLAKLLPSVLLDPEFQKSFFLSPGRTVDLIVQHVFVDPDKRDESSERREFQLGDLPLRGAHYEHASQPARDAIDFILGEDGMESVAIALMNRNLEAAIAQTLNFSADHLIDLMSALRRYLKRQGKRLILLIEDFARLQGIDTALLQALITPPSQGDELLCELRWAMAVTTGYFKNLPMTVYGRTTLIVDMDKSKPVSLPHLTAGYLNALRHGESKLKDLLTSDIKSYCDNCEKKKSGCLDSFGEVNGIGLFPFSHKAVDVMAHRTDSLDGGHFNPRKYLRSVLECVLKQGFGELAYGEFPSDALLAKFAGENMIRPLVRQQLQQSDGINFSRRIALLELWDGTGNIVNLPKGVHDAFGIPILQNVDPDPLPTPIPIDNPIPIPIGEHPDVEIIRRWAIDNETLPQSTTNTLRDLVYSALESFIDWDKLGYRKAAVINPKSGSFRKVSINFMNQQTKRTPSLVVLEIRDDAEPALEALLMYKHYRTWDFSDSGKLLASLLEALRIWATDVEAQLRNMYAENKVWSPQKAVVELLLIATYQGNRLKIGDSLLETTVIKIWETKTPKTLQCIHRPFSDLNVKIVNFWPKLTELLRTLSSGTKGGQVGNFMRITPVLRAIQSLRQHSFKLEQTPPITSFGSELNDLAELYRKVQNEFAKSLDYEKSAWGDWYSSVLQSIGEGTSIAELITTLNDTTNALTHVGINAGQARRNLNEAIQNMNPNMLDRALEHARLLGNANSADVLIRIASIGDSRENINQLISLTEAFLQTAEAAITTKKATSEQSLGLGLQQSEQNIEQSLNQLESTLNSLYQLTGDSL